MNKEGSQSKLFKILESMEMVEFIDLIVKEELKEVYETLTEVNENLDSIGFHNLKSFAQKDYTHNMEVLSALKVILKYYGVEV